MKMNDQEFEDLCAQLRQLLEEEEGTVIEALVKENQRLRIKLAIIEGKDPHLL